MRDFAFSSSSSSVAELAASARDTYRRHFADQVAAGTIKPLVLPYAVLGSFLLPVLYLSVPHARRPWLYAARWPLLAFIVVFNVRETRTTSSANFAVGYAVGLMHAWGVVWAATLLVWTRPQWEAERVAKRRREKRDDDKAEEEAKAAPDEDVARSLRAGYEYYWQAYPADAPWPTRLGWAADLAFSFRGAGWNWCVPVLPRFAQPDKPRAGARVDLRSLPVVSRQGFRRYRTGAEWLRAQVPRLVLDYLVLDVLCVLMRQDPHFIVGPENAYHHAALLPPWLAALSPPLRDLWHSLGCFAAIVVVLHLVMTLWQLTTHFLLPEGPVLALATGRTARPELWACSPSTNGGFVHNVLDRGLAGFWGGWWHQTFRTAFAAPGSRLTLATSTNRAVAGLLAFAQSGFLHAMGSLSSLPPTTRPWRPFFFFVLCWAGTLAQAALVALLRSCLRTTTVTPAYAAGDRSGKKTKTTIIIPPTWLRRAGNLLFCFAYLHACQRLLCDDLARAALWLLEPVPFSPVRAVLGLLGGEKGEWWRWGDPALWPGWYYGGSSRWWVTGVAL